MKVFFHHVERFSPTWINRIFVNIRATREQGSDFRPSSGFGRRANEVFESLRKVPQDGKKFPGGTFSDTSEIAGKQTSSLIFRQTWCQSVVKFPRELQSTGDRGHIESFVVDVTFFRRRCPPESEFLGISVSFWLILWSLFESVTKIVHSQNVDFRLFSRFRKK